MSDFIIQQGADAAYIWPVTNEDGSAFDPAGWTARMQIRSQSGTLLHEFSSADDNLNFGGLGLTAVWTSTETNSWKWSGGFYDLYLVDSVGGQSLRVDSGYISVSKAVTV